MSFLYNWFRGFEKGLEAVDDTGLEALLRGCGRACADTGVRDMYIKLYKECGKDIDLFFEKLSIAFGGEVAGRVITPGREWEIDFERCLCDLHNELKIDTPRLCECSRQSLIYVMGTLMPDADIEVKPIMTVLGGGEKCRFRIADRRERLV